MAKRFGGFTPQQQQTLLSPLGYTGPAQQDDMNKFMMSNPKAAAMMGRSAQMARARIEGGPQKVMQVGGYMAPPTPMQQMQERATNLDYNSLYAQPNQQPMQQPMAMQVGGVVDDEQDMTNNQQQGIADTVNDDVTIDPVEPVYDPTQGLPDPVGDLYTDPTEAMNKAFEGDFNTGTEGQNQSLEGDKQWATTTVDAMSNVTDPKNYTLRKDGSYFTLVYPDGTEIKTGHRNRNYAIGRANILAAATTATRDVVTPEEKEKRTSAYESQLQQYQDYQSGQAQTIAETPAAELVKAAQNKVTTSQNLIANYNKELAGLAADDPKRAQLEKFIADEQVKLNQASADLTQAQQRQSDESKQASKERVAEIEGDPSSAVTKQDVETISDEAREAGKVDTEAADAGEADIAGEAEMAATGVAPEPTAREAVTYTAEETQQQVEDTLSKLEAATGKPRDEALAEAQTMNPEDLAQLGLTAAQIDQAVQVQAPDKREIEEGEMIEGSTVDMTRLEEEALDFEAATGTPSTEATVKGQLTGLMKDFEGDQTPAWAAGAMRAATQRMAARGLAASSMAGQAIVQAAMESAVPIAMADAATVARFEEQNISNRQQVAVLKAEQRAKFLGIEFDQAFETRVLNAAKVSDIANQNFSAEVEIALENARLTNSVDLANLDARNAKILSDAAAMTTIDRTNLDNKQQAALQQAEAFLAMDMKEFDARQQVNMFKAESVIQSVLTDTAAENAAKQFNATSENQTNQFYDSLISQVQQFNVDQENSMKMFEAEQANTIAMFNTEQKNRREEFNASQALIIEQANAKWEQEIALTDTAATNAANRDEAQAANEMTAAAYEAQKQADRDTMSYAFQTANNNADRSTEIALQTMRNEASANDAAASKSAAFAKAAGTVIANMVG